mgnify:CR=1 FL=1
MFDASASCGVVDEAGIAPAARELHARISDVFPGGNTMIPAIMVGEKAADLILADAS